MGLFTELADKVTHLKALAIISICDNKFNDAEKDHLIALQNLYGVPDELLRLDDINTYKDQDLPELLKDISNKSSNIKLSLIQDLISCAYCDGVYSEVEKEKLRSIGSLLGIDNNKLSELEELNMDLINSYKKLALALDY